MSSPSEADRLRENAEAEKKAAEDTAAATAAATANWPIGGYDMFISLLFLSALVVLPICVDVSAICVVHAYLIRYQYEFNTINSMFMIIYGLNQLKIANLSDTNTGGITLSQRNRPTSI